MSESPQVLSPQDFLNHWQGHRALTRRVIEAFPEDQLFTFKVGHMRSFGEMAGELLLVSEMTLSGMTSGEWPEPDWTQTPGTKADLLRAWDDLSARLKGHVPQLPSDFFQAQHPLPWGKMSGWAATSYNVDNEIHHRGQGYVYLRALGIEPPPFWER